MTSLPITFETTRNTHAFCRALDEWVTEEYGTGAVGGMIAFDADHRVLDIRVYVIKRSREEPHETPYGDGEAAHVDHNEWIDDVGPAYVMSFLRHPHLGVPVPAIAKAQDTYLFDATSHEAEHDGYIYRGHLVVTQFTEGLIAEPDDPRMIEARESGELVIDTQAPEAPLPGIRAVDGYHPDDAGRAAIRRLEQRMFGNDQPAQGKAGQPTDLPDTRPDVPKAFYN